MVLADVLEHLRRPDRVLRILRDYLTPTGYIIASIPNIAFILYRVLLLLGEFDYCPRGGIMDVDHLRFFTKKTAQELFRQSGYEIILIKAVNIVKNRFFFLRFLGPLFPGLFALQFLIKAKSKQA